MYQIKARFHDFFLIIFRKCKKLGGNYLNVVITSFSKVGDFIGARGRLLLGTS